MICASHPHERVYLLVNDEPTERQVRRATGQSSRRHGKRDFAQNSHTSMSGCATTDRLSSRATGRKIRLAFNDWIFNGWGGKYQVLRSRTNASLGRSPRYLKIPVFDHEIILEGGSIEVNGAGTCIDYGTVSFEQEPQSAFESRRDRGVSQRLAGCQSHIWLGEGIVGDDTDGHIDDIARFVDPTTVVCVVEAEFERRKLSVSCKTITSVCRRATDQNGAKLSVVKLPCPEPVYYRRRALAGELREFLYCQRRRAGAGLR